MADLRSADGDTLTEVNSGNRLAVRKLLHLSDLPLLARFARKRFGG
jgi:digeranylgeranylglycerophospholipid reductase